MRVLLAGIILVITVLRHVAYRSHVYLAWLDRLIKKQSSG
jgi:hypothetical protein